MSWRLSQLKAQQNQNIFFVLFSKIEKLVLAFQKGKSVQSIAKSAIFDVVAKANDTDIFVNGRLYLILHGAVAIKAVIGVYVQIYLFHSKILAQTPTFVNCAIPFG